MKTCPNCGEEQVEGTNGFFCGSLEGTSGRVYHTTSCERLKNKPRRSVEIIKQLESERDALQARVKRLEEAGDALQSAVVGVEGMTHWQWLATAHEADLKWRAAKESKP